MPIPRPGPTDYQDTPGYELDVLFGALCDLAEDTAAVAAAHAANTSNPHSVNKSQVGLGSVDNTSDAGKPVSTAQQTALDLKANLASPTFTGTVGGVTASMVGAPAGSGTSTGTNTGDSATPAETTTTVGSLINGATSKSTPVDADQLGLMDSNASNVLKKLSWANIKTTLQSIFATLAGTSGGQTLYGGTGASENLTLYSTTHATKGNILLGTSSAYDGANMRLGVGTTSPSAKIHGVATTEQLRLGYDVSNYLSITVASDGSVTITPTGSNVTIPGTKLTQKSTAALESATLGSELLSSSNWTSTGWTGSFGAGWAHTTGNTTALTNTLAAVNGNLYQIAYTVTGRTAGSFTITFGGVTSSAFTATGTWGPKATSTGTLSFTPTTDFDGTIVVSIKQITATYAATYAIQDSTGANAFEIRNTLASLNNSFIGVGAGNYNTTGSNNSAQGVNALFFNTTGNYNSAQGAYALSFNTTGNYNSAQGSYALRYNTTGSYNSAQGMYTLFFNTTGNYNSAQGAYALFSNTTGSQNSALGYLAGRYIADGATALNAPSNSLFLGYNTKASADGLTNENVIGYNATGIGSNSVSIGNSAVTQAQIYGACSHILIDATTNSAVTVESLIKNVTGAGVGAAGLGPRLIFGAESSTTTSTTQADITVVWIDATHATRTSRLALSAWDTAAREGIRIEGDGSVARLGFYGATAVVKPTALTATVAAAPAGGTGTASGGWDTSGNRDLAIATINNLKTRVDQLETKLQALGLLT